MKLSENPSSRWILYLFAIFSLFAAHAKESLSTEDRVIAERIGWMPSTTYFQYCPGQYRIYPTNSDLPSNKTRVSADQASVLQAGRSTLKGHVLFEKYHQSAEADEGFVDTDEQGQIKTVFLNQNVIITEPDKRILADQVTWHQNETWEAKNVLFRLDKQPTAWGKASNAARRNFSKYRLKNSTYTTCPPGDHFWQIKTQQIDLNPATGRGHSQHTWLYIKKMPVAYLPYFDFPIDKRRQSGFLFPAFQNSDRSGVTLAAPYYWNLAPNYDLTTTPRFMSKRGLLLEGLFRYLTPTGQGKTDLSFLPNDRAFADFKDNESLKNPAGRRLSRLQDFSNDRWAAHWEDSHQYNPSWGSTLAFNQVSDDYYFQDFGQGVLATTQNQLNQEGVVTYSGMNWSGLGRIQHFQTLHPINESTIDDSYSRLPQLVLNADYPDIHRLDYQLNSEFVYFDKPRHPDTGQFFTTGSRTYLAPIIRYPLQQLYGYVTPQAKLSLTHYELNHSLLGNPPQIDRGIPMFSVDSGLFFDRNFRFHQTEYQQTLEPRLYYLYVPFKRQTEIPLFDTSLYAFDSSQLFRDNRFTGIDRINDANQVTAAITSRLLEDETGIEKISASVGQIYYLRDRLVTLCATHDCEDENAIAVFSDKTRVSPLVATVNYHLMEDWFVTLDTSWDTDQGTNLYSNTTLHYAPPNQQIVDISYYNAHNAETINNKVDDLRQTKLAFYWPIKEQWGTIGGWYYNLTQHRSQSYFYGVEYNNCCWATRVVAEREFVALNPRGSPTFNNNVYLQIQLKGLGNLGTSDSSNLLRTNILGYRDLFTT